MIQSHLAAQIAAGLVTFHDDRNKTSEILTAIEVLYEDTEVALVTAKFLPDPATYRVLFHKTLGDVLTSEFDFWCTNYRQDVPTLLALTL